MEFKDYYGILGVEPDADEKAIKTAYRRLARKYHPDVSDQGDAEERFREVVEAWEVLGDRERRAEYDELRQYARHGQPFEPPPDWSSGGARGHAGAGYADFSEFFESIFGAAGAAGAAGMGGSGWQGMRRRGRDIELELPVFLEETLSDESKPVRYRVPRADGSGRRVAEQEKTLSVRIPRGVADGERIRVKGQGEPGFGGGPDGDLYLHVRLVPHPLFDVEAHNLIITVPLAPWEAALGARIEVPTLDGRIHLTIPPDSQSGQRLRVRGKGLPARNGRGDLYAVLKVVMPPGSSDAVKGLWRQLAEQAAFDPRAEWRS